MKPFLLGTVASLLLAGFAEAQSDALIIANSDTSLRARLSGTGDLSGAPRMLERAGFDVVEMRDATAAQLHGTLARFANGLAADSDRVAVVLTGRFVHTATDAYLLPVEFDETARTGLVFDRSLRLSDVLGLLAAFPGQAVLILGEADPGTIDNPFLRPGAGRVEVPQGVTLMRGSPDNVARLARQDLPVADRPLAEAGRAAGLQVSGYAPKGWVFLPSGDAPQQVAAAPDPEPEEPLRIDPGPDRGEARLWETVTARDDLDGYRTYLAAFPEGAHSNAARQRVRAIEADPFHAERAAEEALKLDRESRREIQRNLSLLDFDTRGIDGIFGPGTRGAVKSWQAKNGFAASGYLDREMIARLNAQAARRAAELEAEAQRRQEQQEQQDRAYWDETGAQGDVAGLRAYLQRYPDGVFAEVANDRLGAIEADRRAQAEGRDRDAWERARADGRVPAYQSYLADYPEGAFAQQARAEIAELQRPSGEREAAARAEAQENALGLNAGARRLAEDRLRALGLKPGEVDGRFDDKTRRAIRRYQDARRLSVTGYLDQATVVRLLADSLLR